MMKKNCKKLFLLMAVIMTAMVCLAFSASAETWGNFEYGPAKGDPSSVMIKGYNGKDGKVVIPGEINGKKVSYISLEGSKNIKSVTVSGNVESITSYAFSDCVNLKTVTIAEGVTEIGANAFSGCTRLSKITIADSVTDIGMSAFENTAYYNDNANWNKGVLYIGNHLIKAQNSVSGTYKVKSGTVAIHYGAFSECEKLKGVVIPASVKSIGTRAFWYCPALKSISITDSTRYIGTAAFADTAYYNTASNWKNGILYVGNHLVSVKADTSGKCSIKKGTVTIARGAFEGCTNLTAINIPDSVVYIDDFAFGESLRLPPITVGSGNKYYSSDASGVLFNKAKTVLIKYPAKSTKNSYAVPSGVKEIKAWAFSSCVNLKSVVIPKTVKIIDGCNSVEKVCYTGTQKQWDAIELGSWNFFGEVVCNYSCSHKWSLGSCTKPKSCMLCGATSGKAAGHKYKSACAEKCSACGETRKVTHTYKTTTTKATLTANGKTVSKCTVCGNAKTVTIYFPKTIKLSKTSYTYNGKVQTPSVTVKDSKGNALKKDTDYTVKYSAGRKNTGKYTVTVTFKGKYSGTKKLEYTIVPKAVSKITVAQNETSIKLTWNKVTGADGYRVYLYNAKTKKYTSLKTLTATSYMVSGLKPLTTYQFKIIAYKNVGGTVIWGEYTSMINASTGPAIPAITAVASTAKKRVAVAWTNVAGETGYELYASTKKDTGYKKVVTTKADVTKGVRTDFVSGRTYYFKVAAYRTVGNTKVYSGWSAVKSIKVK